MVGYFFGATAFEQPEETPLIIFQNVYSSLMSLDI